MITVMFSCDACSLKDEEVQVRARKSHEDVVWWLENIVMLAIAKRHALRSILCESNTASEVNIPIDKDDPNSWIGKQTERKPIDERDLLWIKNK